MLRHASTRLQSLPPLRALRPSSLRPRPARSALPLRRTMATVTVEGIPKEPTDLDQVTTLPNGLRVASEALPGSFSGVGVYVEAGSRFETDATRGVSHIMDRLAFKSTSRHSADEMLERVEALGGNMQCASSREAMMYQAATFNAAVPETVALLADTIRDPRLTPDEVAAQLETARYEIAEIWAKPELILPELLHAAAFRDNTLGNPLLCPEERLQHIDRRAVVAYRDRLYRPEAMVLAFAGVEHHVAVALAEQYFGDMESTPALESEAGGDSKGSSTFPSVSSSSSAAAAAAAAAQQQPRPSIMSKMPFFKNTDTPRNAAVLSTPRPPAQGGWPAAHYTGGFLSLAPQARASDQQPSFTHMQVAFEGLPVGSDDIYALATLQTLLGGGGSFSAGGPGKGMFSRLYTNVLNQHGWVESCVAFNHSYLDSGLFGIAASCLPGHALGLLDTVCEQLRALTLDCGPARLHDGEVERAKKQLRSSLLMNLESRMVELEDLGRSVQVHGRKVPVADMCRRIKALTVADLRRVASAVVGGAVANPGAGSGAPAVVVQEAHQYGLASRPLSWDHIQDRIYDFGLGRRR